MCRGSRLTMRSSRSRFAARLNLGVSHMKIPRIATLTLVILASSGCTKDPVSYEDCILQKLSRPATKSASEAIIDACRLKFPEKIPPKQELKVVPQTEIAKLKGRFRARSGISYGNLYNGTDSWKISELTILVWEPSDKPGLFDDMFGERYKVKLESGPLTSTSFDLQTNSVDSKEYKWRIVEAKGVQVTE